MKKSIKTFTGIGLLVVLNFLSINILQSQEISAEDIQVLYEQQIPMRDHVNLSANIFMPENMTDPLPAILVLTPYNNDHNTQRGIYYSKNGYVFVTVDTRGRGNSEGIFIPFENEGKDGYDVVEWIAQQSWCNGKVAMMGGSYKGMVQWLTAKENPPHLVSMAPTATVCPGIDATRDRNIYRSFNLQIMSIVSGKTQNRNNFFSEYTISKVMKNYREHHPYADLLQALNTPDKKMQTVFKRWLSHPTFDEYWKEMLPNKKEFKRINIPILSITGYFDDDQPGHMYYYNNFQRYASEDAKSKMYFVIGPWDHSGTRKPKSKLGGMNFGNKAVLNMLKLHKEWFDWTMKDGKKPEFLQDHVSYYEIGANKWSYVSDLNSLSNEDLSFYLSSPSIQPHDVFQSGSLSDEVVNNIETDNLIYDPLKPAFKDLNGRSSYLTNQTDISEKGWLYYHSAPFTKDIELNGFITLNAFIEINTPDTDFYFKLVEVKADGTIEFLGSGVMRARFRNSLEKEELVKAGSINEYQINSLYMINNKISKGSRVRLLFGYLDSPNYQKNYNSGKDVSYETESDARTATIKLYCNEEYPSQLILPIKTR